MLFHARPYHRHAGGRSPVPRIASGESSRGVLFSNRHGNQSFLLRPAAFVILSFAAASRRSALCPTFLLNPEKHTRPQPRSYGKIGNHLTEFSGFSFELTDSPILLYFITGGLSMVFLYIL